jgi:AraC-like DNA-binding protein
MQEFYKKALVALILLLVAEALAACLCIYLSYPSATLVPRGRGGLHWRLVATTDAAQGGTSTIRILDPGGQSLRFDFRLTKVAAFSFVSADLLLEDSAGNAVPADLSRYTIVTFRAKCSPASSLLFTMPTYDASISKRGEYGTYPSPETFFPCSEKGTPVSLDLTHLIIPPWWFEQMKVDPARQSYRLDQVAKFVFGVSQRSPREVDSHVEISELTLHGRDYRYITALAILLVTGCGAFGIWFFRAHSRALAASLNSRLRNDLSFVAYRQLTLEPFKDKEKAAILQFIATHFTNPELDLDSVAARIGANRDKINEILKMELGMTFTRYINKLRLMEAARLLTDKTSAPIAEIAYSVGYANASYFNKLFKEEYGCTPKAFRALATQPEVPSVSARADS